MPEQLATETPDWTKIVGRDPDAFDITGTDPHLIASVTPRAGLPEPSPTPGDNGSDPVHGREWDTQKSDLQYACTFLLPTPKQCAPSDGCECNEAWNPPLCGSTLGQQIRGKAYPTLRPFRVARGLGAQGLIGSICSSSYEGTMKALAARVISRLEQ